MTRTSVAAISLVSLLTGTILGWFGNGEWSSRLDRARAFALTLQARELYAKGSLDEAMEAALGAAAAAPLSYSSYDFLGDLLARERGKEYSIRMYAIAAELVLSGTTTSGPALTDSQKMFERDRIDKKIAALKSAREEGIR